MAWTAVFQIQGQTMTGLYKSSSWTRWSSEQLNRSWQGHSIATRSCSTAVCTSGLLSFGTDPLEFHLIIWQEFTLTQELEGIAGV